MSNKSILCLGAGGIVILGVFIYISMYFSYNGEEVRARNTAEAQIENVGNVLDNMWKNFQEIGGIANHERETAMKLFTEYAGARTAEGQGRMMAWVTEQNPTLEQTLFLDLQDRLTAGRQEFRNSQTYALDLVRAHKDIVLDPFKSMFLKRLDPVEFALVLSDDSRAAAETGVDNRTFQLPGS